MRLELSTINDVEKIIEIIDEAKIYLASLNIDQWQNGYPNKTEIENDISNNESYVVFNDQNQIIATSMFTINPEQTYKIIEGSWIIDESKKYGVIHRLAIKKEYKKMGVASFMFEKFHEQLKRQKINSLKIDTHEQNLGMQSLIQKLGYQYCGVIYTKYQAKRLAFEKILNVR